MPYVIPLSYISGTPQGCQRRKIPKRPLGDRRHRQTGRGRRNIRLRQSEGWSVERGDMPMASQQMLRPSKGRGLGETMGLHRCGIGIPGLFFGPPIAPRPRNRLASSAAGGVSPVSPVLLPEAKEKFLIIFGRACTCRKFLDSAALGGVPSDRRRWGGGSKGGRQSPL